MRLRSSLRTRPSLTFSPSPTEFVTYFVNNNRDFLTVNSTLNSKGRTDQAFTTRSQLIQLGDLVTSAANIANLLQYLGTFSRELNSPTWHSATNPIPQRFQLVNLAFWVYTAQSRSTPRRCPQGLSGEYQNRLWVTMVYYIGAGNMWVHKVHRSYLRSHSSAKRLSRDPTSFRF